MTQPSPSTREETRSVRRPSGPEVRAIIQDLRAVPAEEDLERAWCDFAEKASHIKAVDARNLGDLEDALEGRSEFPQLEPVQLQVTAWLLVDRVGDDLRDAWARLHARDLVALLRSKGASLRAIHDDVGVSTPYLSQLANGTGPVPSQKILDRLQRGVRGQNLESEERPDRPDDPSGWISNFIDRGRIVRNQMVHLNDHRHSISVQIDGLPDRQQNKLQPILENLTVRTLDAEAGQVTASLLQELVEGDEELHKTLLDVIGNEDSVAIMSYLIQLDDKGRRGLLALLQSQGSVGKSAFRDERPPKQPLEKE